MQENTSGKISWSRLEVVQTCIFGISIFNLQHTAAELSVLYKVFIRFIQANVLKFFSYSDHGGIIENNYNPSTNPFLFFSELSLFSTRSFSKLHFFLPF